MGIPTTAEAVSWVAQRTHFIPSYSPSTVPGFWSLGKMGGRPSAEIISGSNLPVSAFTMPVVVALVYSLDFTPQSFQRRYSGIIRKSVTPSSLPVSLSA